MASSRSATSDHRYDASATGGSGLRQYAVCLSIRGRRCVVVGGGAVAERRVLGLLAAGARVVVISPSLTDGLAALSSEGAVERIARGYQKGDLAGAHLAVIATDDRATNREALAEAHRRRVLVNVADNAQASDYTLPAVLRKGDLVVAVSTNGRSPAAAQYVRDELSRLLTAEHHRLLDVMAQVRAELAARRHKVAGEVWRAAIDAELLGLIAGGSLDEARAKLHERLIGQRAEDD